MRTVFVFINGIMTMPGKSENWTGRAVTWTHLNTARRAEKVEYFAGPLDRVFGQKKRRHKLQKTLSFYAKWRIVLVGHSNGCDVISDVAKAGGLPPNTHLHLVSGACKADFTKNGFNDAAIKSVTVYKAGRDKAMWLANTPIARLLGYGALGLLGPLRASRPVKVVEATNYSHSEWWTAENFNATMNIIHRHAF